MFNDKSMSLSNVCVWIILNKHLMLVRAKMMPWEGLIGLRGMKKDHHPQLLSGVSSVVYL